MKVSFDAQFIIFCALVGFLLGDNPIFGATVGLGIILVVKLFLG